MLKKVLVSRPSYLKPAPINEIAKKWEKTALERIALDAFTRTSRKSATLLESLKDASFCAFSYCPYLARADIRCDSSVIQTRAFNQCPRLRLSYHTPDQYIECMRMQRESLFQILRENEGLFWKEIGGESNEYHIIPS